MPASRLSSTNVEISVSASVDSISLSACTIADNRSSPVLAWRAQRIEHGDQVARPLPQLRHDGARKAQHVADHLDGDRRSILGDEIEVRLLRRLRKPARRNRFDRRANACETRLCTRWCGAQPR